MALQELWWYSLCQGPLKPLVYRQELCMGFVVASMKLGGWYLQAEALSVWHSLCSL
jgi:hypothetical protein